MNTWKDTLLFCIVSLFGNLLPLLFGVVYYFFAEVAWPGWSKFYGDGQFYIYSATIFTTAGWTFYTFKVRNSDKHSIGALLSAIFILFVSVMYAWKLSGVSIRDSLVASSSIVPFLIAVPLLVWANRLSHTKPDVLKHHKDAIDEMMSSLPSN